MTFSPDEQKFCQLTETVDNRAAPLSENRFSYEAAFMDVINALLRYNYNVSTYITPLKSSEASCQKHEYLIGLSSMFWYHSRPTFCKRYNML